MYQNWIQRDISGHIGTKLGTVTQAIVAQIVGKGTRKKPPRQTQWEVIHQMIIRSKVNNMSGKR